jgi:hypothetical protein
MSDHLTADIVRSLRQENTRLSDFIAQASKSLVPRADYDRVVEERNAAIEARQHADAAADGLAKALSDAQDAREARTGEQAVIDAAAERAQLSRSRFLVKAALHFAAFVMSEGTTCTIASGGCEGVSRG